MEGDLAKCAFSFELAIHSVWEPVCHIMRGSNKSANRLEPDLQASVLVMAIPQRVAGHDKTSVIVEFQWGPLALLLFNIDPTKYASPCAC